MKIKITDKNGVRIDGKTYLQGQVIDKEEHEVTKQSLVDSKLAEETKETKVV